MKLPGIICKYLIPPYIRFYIKQAYAQVQIIKAESVFLELDEEVIERVRFMLHNYTTSWSVKIFQSCIAVCRTEWCAVSTNVNSLSNVPADYRVTR